MVEEDSPTAAFAKLGQALDPERWDTLLRRLNALPETGMRREVLGERLRECDADEVYDFLVALVRGVEQRRTAHLKVLDAVNGWILESQERGETYELLADVYRLAVQAGEDGIAHLLLIARPQRGPATPMQAPGDQEMSSLALGQRKFLARGLDRFRLERLLSDPDPAVLRNLLRNPRLTEQDVMRLATRRPVIAEVIEEVYASRWSKRYAIRLALVCNPYTPTRLSLKLVGFLLYRDLRRVATDGNLHAIVRAAAGRLATERRAKRDGD